MTCNWAHDDAEYLHVAINRAWFENNTKHVMLMAPFLLLLSRGPRCFPEMVGSQRWYLISLILLFYIVVLNKKGILTPKRFICCQGSEREGVSGKEEGSQDLQDASFHFVSERRHLPPRGPSAASKMCLAKLACPMLDLSVFASHIRGVDGRVCQEDKQAWLDISESESFRCDFGKLNHKTFLDEFGR